MSSVTSKLVFEFVNVEGDTLTFSPYTKDSLHVRVVKGTETAGTVFELTREQVEELNNYLVEIVLGDESDEDDDEDGGPDDPKKASF